MNFKAKQQERLSLTWISIKTLILNLAKCWWIRDEDDSSKRRRMVENDRRETNHRNSLRREEEIHVIVRLASTVSRLLWLFFLFNPLCVCIKEILKISKIRRQTSISKIGNQQDLLFCLYSNLRLRNGIIAPLRGNHCSAIVGKSVITF